MAKSTGDTFLTNYDGNQIRNTFGNLALSNQYQVNIQGIEPQLQLHFSTAYKDDPIDISRIAELGILCTDANLPTSSFATAEVKDNFIGVTQEFAHTRLYTDLDFTFYVDKNYDMIRFFEGWMDFISGGNSSELREPASSGDARTNIYRRFNYPKYYKTSGLYVLKFERDIASASKNLGTEKNNYLKYQFINAFPKSLTTTPVSYGPAELLKVTVSFNFDRYLITRTESLRPVPSEREFLEATEKLGTGPGSGNIPQEQLNADRATQTSTPINPTISRQGTDAFRGRR